MRWFFLVGFMGVGKTTLGMKVAKKLGLSFWDLDERIERDTGTSIGDIFETGGEDVFREHETRVLQELIASDAGGVVATGGGAFTIERNRDLMAAAGVSVWLDTPIDAIVERVGGGDRPLWRGEAEARALAYRREQYYLLANHRLELGTDSTDEGASRLHELLAPYGPDKR
jgi:shikimate kinase